MDPFCDYYLCTEDDETVLVAAFWWDDEALEMYDSVQKLPYWQAVQLTLALMELDRSPAHVPDLFPLAAFLGASDERIGEFFGSEW